MPETWIGFTLLRYHLPVLLMVGRVSITGLSSQVSVDKTECAGRGGGQVVLTTSMFRAGEVDSSGTLDSILQFDGETQQWEEIGQLRQKRAGHAHSIININNIAAYLNCS